MAGRFGEIISSLSMAAGKAVRRNAADNGFEAFTPSDASAEALFSNVEISGTSGAAHTVGNFVNGTVFISKSNVGQYQTYNLPSAPAEGTCYTFLSRTDGGGWTRIHPGNSDKIYFEGGSTSQDGDYIDNNSGDAMILLVADANGDWQEIFRLGTSWTEE